jgi:uncharacterized membrane protein
MDSVGWQRFLECEERVLLVDVEIGRVLHILAIVHWIGGVGFVTSVALPTISRLSEPARGLSMFEELEHRFSKQAKITVTLAGLTGLYMTYRLNAWDRFTDLAFWWMHFMFVVWLVVMLILFIAEPLFLQDGFIAAQTATPRRPWRWSKLCTGSCSAGPSSP